MKKLGNTDDGRYLVEMTRDEVLAFDRLCEMTEGRTVWEAISMHDEDRVLRSGNDLSSAIECVYAYTTTLGAANELQQQVARVVSALMQAEEVTPK